jgi:hypothetical protein
VAQLPVVITPVKPGMDRGVDDHGGEVEDAPIPKAAHGVKIRGKQRKDSDSA